MKPVAFDYERPTRVEEVCELLASDTLFAKPLAGGQSLGPMLNLRLVQPDLVVDVTRVPELSRVDDEGDAVVVGACVTTAAIEDGCVPGRTGRVLAGVAGAIAYRAVRNRGTIGGSLAHADPAADWPSCLVALGAEAVVRGPAGSRAVAVEDFMAGAFEVSLEPGEILEALRIPRLSESARWAYYKFCRKTGEFAEAIGAVLHDPERSVHRVVMGATHARPIVLADPSELLSAKGPRGGEGLDLDAARGLLARAGLEADTYESRIHITALARALEQAA
ncbi:MAG: carbon monoxide dehydrogenase [Gammaproteobacteria bacterium]|nr:carbon monoxide dehydrogenase [Gammaproteobacteria bacterium]NIR84386.1 carbon monoxide dehydrogenase [Gammaproteobacteria bacterium]NIR90867.1 carbon monoxide dehydrogenase [Gammaproteobacteria bacterium]NIU07053.1 carbon monoxide dehydrogenase [Gammaproteobacteria bacterium]NIV76182.1 carbon monoxide dehydrogenase [Gammaproteobacteria bacterium]